MEQNANLRRSGIGGSDAAVIIGASKWKTPRQLWREKIGEAEDVAENSAMRWGKIMEPVIIVEYQRATGAIVRPGNDETIRHPDFPFLMAHLDATVGNDGILEVKTARSEDGWGREGTAEIPAWYYPQVQHYLGVTGKKWADVAVLIGGSDFRVYHVERDGAFIEALTHAEVDFWGAVEAKIPPEPIDAELSTDEVEAAVVALKAANAKVEEAEAEVTRLTSIIQRYMSDANILRSKNTGATLATWNEQSRVSVDSKALLAAFPDLREKFSKPSTFRVFRLK